MSEIPAGGDLGRSLTGEAGEFGEFGESEEDETMRLRANVRMAFVLCVFVLSGSALAFVLVA
ncbi:hypothetical protein DFP74_1551 [Nocardiopsis sp. Huas11]|uniref:hypothetical protein n=1 Tax=Nocardiopsis sp. Huas11 TaxID=2183912 RepID=UPI000EAF0803|nr:hypothetical protein [Nocardiopsis sp. Huas11]RKS05935.1 hypothetical protein DFP74_1551 [Nocardiopsis sp. Huas11]